MTNQQGAPEALRLAAEVLDWMPTSDTQRALWDRHQEALAVVNAALVEAQQPAPSAAAAVGEVEPVFWMNEKGHTWSNSDWKQFPKHRAKYPIPLYAHRPAPQPSPTPQADSLPAQFVDQTSAILSDKAVCASTVIDKPAPVLDSLALMRVVMRADEALAGRCARGTTNWAAAIGKAVQDAVLAARTPADSVTAPAGGAEEVDKALNDYAQAFMARAMGWTREHGDAMPDARTKLYSAISSYARGLSTTSPTPQADSQPGDKDLVAVPRDIIGAACSAIDKKRDGAKTLAELRRYTVGDLSAAITSAPQADSVLEDVGRANWQDISTAPKDGTRFVAVGNNYGLYSETQHTCIAQWFRGCWMEVSDWNETSELKYLTHWMPLPPLPGSAARAPADSVTAPVNEAVAYLDIGAGGYIDLGTDLSEEALSRLPKGRHALTIAGTYGIDGYTPTTSADSVLEDAARLDWLALAGPVSICVVIDRPHDGEVEVATDDVTGYGKTLREAIDAAMKKGGAT